MVTETDEDSFKCEICPDCGEFAISTMCMAYCEVVCIPCQKGVGMFNSWEQEYISKKDYDALREKYAGDIQKLAFENGGATCSKCNKSGGNNCATCKINEEFEHYKPEGEDGN
jgi:hypothetical protein